MAKLANTLSFLIIFCLVSVMIESIYSPCGTICISDSTEPTIYGNGYAGCSSDGSVSLRIDRADTYSPTSTCAFFVQIPPNSKLSSVSIEGNQSTIENASSYPMGAGDRVLKNVLEYKEVTLRIYKFVLLSFSSRVLDPSDTSASTPPYKVINYDWIKVKVNYEKTGPLLRYVEKDDMTDNVINAFNVEHPPVKIVWANESWRAFQEFSVNRATTFNLPEGHYDYIVISPSDWTNIVEPLADWKNQKGISTYVASLDWIASSYSGSDLQIKIREFIKDAFNTWQIRYVLFAGGCNRIPTRIVIMNDLPDNIATDWYYGCLDGSWDNNNDGTYNIGSFGSVSDFDKCDWFPEIIIGRMPAATDYELQTMVSKTLSYEQEPSSQPWMNRTLMVGGYQIGEGFSFIWRQFPINITKTTLMSGSNLTAISMSDCINQGISVVSVLAHGSAYGYALVNGTNEIFSIADASSLDNGNMLPLVVAFSCSTATIDEEDFLGKAFLSNPNGGAVAYVGTTRNGGAGDSEFWYYFYHNGGQFALAEYNCMVERIAQGTGYGENWAGSSFLIVVLGDPELTIRGVEKMTPATPTPFMQTPKPESINPLQFFVSNAAFFIIFFVIILVATAIFANFLQHKKYSSKGRTSVTQMLHYFLKNMYNLFFLVNMLLLLCCR